MLCDVHIVFVICVTRGAILDVQLRGCAQTTEKHTELQLLWHSITILVRIVKMLMILQIRRFIMILIEIP